jgi:hypothetical protein
VCSIAPCYVSVADLAALVMQYHSHSSILIKGWLFWGRGGREKYEREITKKDMQHACCNIIMGMTP